MPPKLRALAILSNERMRELLSRQPRQLGHPFAHGVMEKWNRRRLVKLVLVVVIPSAVAHHTALRAELLVLSGGERQLPNLLEQRCLFRHRQEVRLIHVASSKAGFNARKEAALRRHPRFMR